jgi:general L-amino acid transport system substrate-binding protein
LFFDGQGFLVRRGSALSSVLELSGASICALAGSSAERGLNEYFRAHEMRDQQVSTPRWDELVKAYANESCALLTGDISLLSLERSRLVAPTDHILLPEIILKEPMGPAVRRGDEEWFAVVRWVLMALISAEELGVTKENADEQRGSPLYSVRHFLGLEGNHGQGLGLEPDWAYKVVSQVGNYGQIYERTVGMGSVFKLERGFNDLWTRGGLMYSAPFR